MVSKDNLPPKEEEPPKSIRITTTLDYVDAKIVENLRGTFGNSQSSVLNYILKDWIKMNSEMLRLSYGIDIAGFRREIQSTFKTSEIDEKIQARVLKELPVKLKRIRKYKIDKLAEILKVHQETLMNIIILKGEELEAMGLNIFIDGDHILNEMNKQ